MSPSKDRQIIISAHLLKPNLPEPERRQAVNDLLKLQMDTERELAQGKSNIRPVDVVEENGLLIGGYLVIHPAGGRVAFSRLICDHEKAMNIYWEALQIKLMPDLKALQKEFETIAQTAKLK